MVVGINKSHTAYKNDHPTHSFKDSNLAIKNGKIQAPIHIISTIYDDRGTSFYNCTIGP
jgi:hypothetical protein